jgi:hypothetical protein
MVDFTCCPNCSAVWTIEEIEEQNCAACGYPDNDEDEFDPDYVGPDDEGSEPDLMAPNNNERAEQMWNIQHNLK